MTGKDKRKVHAECKPHVDMYVIEYLIENEGKTHGTKGTKRREEGVFEKLEFWRSSFYDSDASRQGRPLVGVSHPYARVISAL